jgi:hypothetical protein
MSAKYTSQDIPVREAEISLVQQKTLTKRHELIPLPQQHELRKRDMDESQCWHARQ